jgi:hypothetical protein
LGKKRPEGQATLDTDQDRYPDMREVVQRVTKESSFPEGDIDRIEVTALSNGEATWRVWPAKSDEPVGGVYSS